MSDRFNATNLKAGNSRLGQIIKHIPFSLVMLGLLLLVAWGTHSFFQELERTWVSQLGFAPRDFWFFRWERLIFIGTRNQRWWYLLVRLRHGWLYQRGNRMDERKLEGCAQLLGSACGDLGA